MRCGKCFVSCTNICFSTLYYSRARGQPVRVQMLPPRLVGRMVYGNGFHLSVPPFPHQGMEILTGPTPRWVVVGIE